MPSLSLALKLKMPFCPCHNLQKKPFCPRKIQYGPILEHKLCKILFNIKQLSRPDPGAPVKVFLVSNSRMRTPQEDWIEAVVVEGRFNAADDLIAGQAGGDDIVVTADIPLASRCLAKGARVLAPTGRIFSQEGIGDALAARDLLSHLRDLGEITGRPAPFGKKNRSRFLQRLDETIRSKKRT
jgi:hypothetical protein